MNSVVGRAGVEPTTNGLKVRCSTKSLVQLHGGRVAADSPGLGKGARFSVYLPASGQAGLTVPVAPAAPRPLGGSLKLHLVDDNADAALMLAGLLEMDGYALARKLREDPRLQNTRLIALTGYGQESDRAKSAAAGFDHHLVKPVIYQQLKELVDQIQTDLLTAA